MIKIFLLRLGLGFVYSFEDFSLDKSQRTGYNRFEGISMRSFEVVFYKKADGTAPAQEFILSLDEKMRTKMLKTIKMLEDSAYELREPYSKALTEGILELRAKVGSDTSRVLYFFVVGKTAVLTNGFIKKTQKTPRKEIELAKKYRADYLKRKGIDDNDKQL